MIPSDDRRHSTGSPASLAPRNHRPSAAEIGSMASSGPRTQCCGDFRVATSSGRLCNFQRSPRPISAQPLTGCNRRQTKQRAATPQVIEYRMPLVIQSGRMDKGDADLPTDSKRRPGWDQTTSHRTPRTAPTTSRRTAQHRMPRMGPDPWACCMTSLPFSPESCLEECIPLPFAACSRSLGLQCTPPT